MPSFTEATVTFGTIPLGLHSAPEHVFAYPAIRPLTLFYTTLIGFRRLSDIGRLCLVFGTTAHSPLLVALFRLWLKASACSLLRPALPWVRRPGSCDRVRRATATFVD
jgi:hypothetical protein